MEESGKRVRRDDLIFPDLSYKIIGSAFDIYNEIGPGHHEKYYQKALAQCFIKRGIIFQEQAYCPLEYDGKVVGKKFLDFLVEGKVVVELKKDDRFLKSHIDQVLGYLKVNDLKLAILVNFGRDGVRFRRIINFN